MAKFLPVGNLPFFEKSMHHYPHAFLLAHEVVKDPYGWADAFQGHKDTSFRILDNSVIELGGAVSLEMVQEAQMITKANVVVLPDVLEDGPATLDAGLSAWPTWGKAFDNKFNNSIDDYAGLMFVPQGKTKQEWIECFLGFISRHTPSWIGIPRNTTGRIVESRRELIEVVRQWAPWANIHLLGFSNNVVDDLLSAKTPGVSTIDSNAPLRVTESKNFWPHLEIPPRGDWFEKTSFDLRHIAIIEDINSKIG